MVTLSDLLSRFGSVEETADGWLAHCPGHPDSTPSLRVAVSDRGKVLVRDRAGCDTADVLQSVGLTMRDLANVRVDVTPPAAAVSQDVPASAADVAALAVRLDGYASAFRRGMEDDSDALDAQRYAAERFGLSGDDSTRLGLGYADDLPGGPRLVVPFRDQRGVARGFQARALAPDAAVRWYGPKSPEGAAWTKLGWFPGSSGWDEVLVCEGPGDALTGAALGYDTIGIRGAGLSANSSVIEDLVAMLDGRQAVIAGDGDPSGRRFSAQLAEALTTAGIPVRILTVPDGLDLTDWRAQDPEQFPREVIRAIAQAAPVSSSQAALSAWDEDRYALTDLGGARYLRDYIESIGSGIRYTEEAGFFLLDPESGVWRKDDRQAVRTHAQAVADLVRELARTASIDGAREGALDADKKRAARLNRYAAHAQSSKGLDAMLRELQAVRGVPASIEDFDRDPDLLAVRNGVIDLRTGTLLPPDPSRLMTRRVDIDYDPNARAERWERFLLEVFPDHEELAAYTQRLVGYGITGHTSEQCFVVHWGTGANGKSVFTDTLTEVFREHTVTTPFSTFEERPSGGIPNDLAALKGSRIVQAAEGEQGKPMAEAMLKRVTGRDMISARFMRKEFFEFRPTFLLMLATNFKPKFRGQDEGLWRRVKLIPWARYFKPEERDHRLGDTLLAEAQGILAWAVRGAIEWYARGLQDPQVVVDATREYRDQSNALDGFLPGIYVFDQNGRVDSSKVFADFQQYADEGNYLDLKRWSQRALYGAIEEHKGVTRKRSTGGKNVFIGIRRVRQSDHAAEDAVTPGEPAQTPRAETPALADSSSAPAQPAAESLHGADLSAIRL